MKKIIFTVFILILMCGCGKQKYNTSYVDLFDTYSTFSMYTNDSKEFEAISNELHDRLIKLNKEFDIYNNYKGINNIKTINDNAGIKPVKVDSDILKLIKYGKEAYKKTDGSVNIAMGSVLKIWHNYRENAIDKNIYAIPSENELISGNEHTDIDNIIIDEKNSTVYISDKNTSIDVGSIAKGYAADYAMDFLKSKGVTSALLNLGGNVACITDETKKSWKTGVTSPDNTDEYISTIDLSNQSAVTSGNYQRYYEYKGKRYHHIIDSKTLFPSQYNKSVTVIADSSLEGDMFSTALFILPYEKGIEIAERNNIKAMWVTAEGENKVFGLEINK